MYPYREYIVIGFMMAAYWFIRANYPEIRNLCQKIAAHLHWNFPHHRH